MRVGDKFTFRPTAFSADREEGNKGKGARPPPVTGRIEYIHPQRRYFTVAAVVHGYTIRESFSCATKD